MINQEAIDFITSLSSRNFEVLPLSGQNGKTPIMKFKDRFIHPRETVKRFENGLISTYGIRLKGLTVIDIDEKKFEHIEAVETVFGHANYIVETSRGFHLYYQGESKVKNPFSFPVDVKSGWNSYVVGPYSIRPDGFVYEPFTGDLIKNSLNPIKEVFPFASTSYDPRDDGIRSNDEVKVPVGKRHNYLLSIARRLINYYPLEDIDELTLYLTWHASQTCEDAEKIPKKEIENIAAWTFSIYEDGKNYSSQYSELKVPRPAIDMLRCLSGGSDAVALYVTLLDKHKHMDNSFAIDFNGMKNGQLTDLGRDRFKRARALLLELGLIQRAENYKVGSRPYTYRFP